jgi:hypothetical protein
VTTNPRGRAYALTILCPIIPGHEVPLRDHLMRLDRGARSPLAALRGTHFARWIVFDRPDHAGGLSQPGGQRSPQLLFDCCLDGDRDAYLEAMRTGMSADVDAVWQHCVGYPGASDARDFAAYFGRHQVDTSLFLAAYPAATVQDVRASLELRQRLIDFAVATQGFAAPALLAAYREAFPDGAVRGPALTRGS